MPFSRRPDTWRGFRSLPPRARGGVASCSCATSSRTNSSAALFRASPTVDCTCHCARSTCRSASCTRAPRWPKIGTGSSSEAWSCKLASKIVRSPPAGRERPMERLGLAKAPAALRSARAASASRSEAWTRGPSLTMRSTSSSVTVCTWAYAPKGRINRSALSRLIELLGGDVALGGGHVVHRREHQERDHERGDHAADDHQRERTLGLATDPGGKRHWQEAKKREQRRHEHRPQLFDAALHHGGDERDSFAPSCLDRAHHEQAEERHLSQQRDESDDRAHRDRHAPGPQAQYPAGQREWGGEQDRRRSST